MGIRKDVDVTIPTKKISKVDFYKTLLEYNPSEKSKYSDDKAFIHLGRYASLIRQFMQMTNRKNVSETIRYLIEIGLLSEKAGFVE